MKSIVYCSILMCLLAMTLPASSQQPAEVNIMVDFNMPTSPTENQLQAAKQDLQNISTEMINRQIDGTLFLTQDVLSTQARLLVTSLATWKNYELAMSGSHQDEKLSTLSYGEQKAILEKSKTYVESCKVCGFNEIIAMGFMPQSFDQNSDTYKVLDELGIQYNAGFQAGKIYAPGHEKDVWPYKVENQNFYAVPISTYSLSGETVPFVDRVLKDKGLSSSQWYDALVAKFDETASKGEPLVILLSTSLSGKGDWLDALKKFLDYGKSKNAVFVTTADLVNKTLPEGYVPPAPKKPASECTTCGSKSNATGSTPTPENLVVNITRV